MNTKKIAKDLTNAGVTPGKWANLMVETQNFVEKLPTLRRVCICYEDVEHQAVKDRFTGKIREKFGNKAIVDYFNWLRNAKKEYLKSLNDAIDVSKAESWSKEKCAEFHDKVFNTCFNNNTFGVKFKIKRNEIWFNEL